MALRMLKPRLATVDTNIAKPLEPPPKEADPHYRSAEHVAWSRAVIARAHGRCQGKGCGREGVRLFADHITELKDGGAPLDLHNGQALCGSCHSTKTHRVKREREARGD